MCSLIRQSVAELDAYVPGEQPDDKSVIKLNTNENPYPPSPKVDEVLRSFSSSRLRLYPDPVSSQLRKSIAQLHDVDLEQVFVGNGSDEILALAIRAFVERDAAVGFHEPTYSLYPVLSAIEGVSTEVTPLGEGFSWSAPRVDRSQLYFIANPNAPTSLRYGQAEVESFCSSFRGVVLIDEAYVDFAEADCMDLARRLKNVLVSRTLSKSYSLAGIRLGYAVGPKPLIEALFKIKDSYNVDALSQWIAHAALDDVEYMHSVRDRILATRNRLAGKLKEKGWHVLPSETNFLWVKPLEGSAGELVEALRRENILVRYFPGERTGDYLRISVGTDEETDALLVAINGMG